MSTYYVLDFAFRDADATGPFTSKTFERICYDGIGSHGAMQDAMFDNGVVSAIFHFGDFESALNAYRRVIGLETKEFAVMCYALNIDGTDNADETLRLEAEIVADTMECVVKKATQMAGGGTHAAMAACAMASSTLAIYNGIDLKELISLIESHHNKVTGALYMSTVTDDRPRAKA